MLLVSYVTRFRALLAFTVIAMFVCAFTLRSRDAPPPLNRPNPPKAPKPSRRVELVMARTKREDTSWVQRHLPDWTSSIYSVDDSSAALTVPANKGHEAMAYLTYLIDRYDSLPDAAVFMHAERFQWHNDYPDYDSLWALQNLNLSHVRAEGYVKLRCVWVLGCPGQAMPFEMVAPHSASPDGGKPVFEAALQDLFPGANVPEVVGVNCCGQFALSREAIRQRPREDYMVQELAGWHGARG